MNRTVERVAAGLNRAVMARSGMRTINIKLGERTMGVAVSASYKRATGENIYYRMNKSGISENVMRSLLENLKDKNDNEKSIAVGVMNELEFVSKLSEFLELHYSELLKLLYGEKGDSFNLFNRLESMDRQADLLDCEYNANPIFMAYINFRNKRAAKPLIDVNSFGQNRSELSFLNTTSDIAEDAISFLESCDPIKHKRTNPLFMHDLKDDEAYASFLAELAKTKEFQAHLAESKKNK